MVNAMQNIGSFNLDSPVRKEKTEVLSLAKLTLQDLPQNSFSKVFNRVDNFLDFGSSKNLDFSHFSASFPACSGMRSSRRSAGVTSVTFFAARYFPTISAASSTPTVPPPTTRTLEAASRVAFPRASSSRLFSTLDASSCDVFTGDA